jgi:hypothetical protein
MAAACLLSCSRPEQLQQFSNEQQPAACHFSCQNSLTKNSSQLLFPSVPASWSTETGWIFFRVVDPDSGILWIRIQGQENSEISVRKCTYELFIKKI